MVDDEALLVCAVAENAASDRDRARTMVFMMSPRTAEAVRNAGSVVEPLEWPIPPIPWIDAVAPKVAAWNDPVAEAFVSVFSNVAPPLAMLSPTMIGALPLTWP